MAYETNRPTNTTERASELWLEMTFAAKQQCKELGYTSDETRRFVEAIGETVKRFTTRPTYQQESIFPVVVDRGSSPTPTRNGKSKAPKESIKHSGLGTDALVAELGVQYVEGEPNVYVEYRRVVLRQIEGNRAKRVSQVKAKHDMRDSGNKFCSTYTALLSRMFVKEYPGYKDFFRTKPSDFDWDNLTANQQARLLAIIEKSKGAA
jgi:hypothetical protein